MVETALADVKTAEAAVAKATANIGSSVSRRSTTCEGTGPIPRPPISAGGPSASRRRIWTDHFERAVAEEQAAEAELDSTKALLAAAATAKVHQARADLDESKANVEVMAELVAKDQVLVDYTTIKSPYDGVIIIETTCGRLHPLGGRGTISPSHRRPHGQDAGRDLRPRPGRSPDRSGR